MRVNSTAHVFPENDAPVMALEVEGRKLGALAPWKRSVWPTDHDAWWIRMSVAYVGKACVFYATHTAAGSQKDATPERRTTFHITFLRYH
jgi:hypothetical protein